MAVFGLFLSVNAESWESSNESAGNPGLCVQ